MLFLPFKSLFTGSGSGDHGTDAEEIHLASAPVEEIAPASPGQTAYAICASCHGAKGEGNAMMHAPALAGQEDWYLKRQINKFKDGLRGTHADDLYGAQMRPMAQMLQDEAQIDTVVNYIAQLPSVHSELTLGGDAKKGEASYMLCMACHGADAEGNAAMNAPSLNGLPLQSVEFVSRRLGRSSKKQMAGQWHDAPRLRPGFRTGRLQEKRLPRRIALI